jgi:CubicO group peptidase (beta-lactamase class C family)
MHSVENVLSDTGVTICAPESAGFCSLRLQRLGSVFRDEVARGSIPGAAVLIVRDGRMPWFDVCGYADRASGRQLRPDGIFRIASLTKPVTVAAALTLLERGVIALADPVARYLPEFGKMNVGVESPPLAGEQRVMRCEPARRAMTLQDLMRHTAGFTYGPFGDSLVQRAYRAAQVLDDQQTNQELVSKLAQLPLAHQPGTTFEYGMSTDVLGRIVEVASGETLDRFMARHIFTPLGMHSTGFDVAPAELRRLAEPHPLTAGAPPPAVPPFDPARPPKWFSGGGGLLSTAADYARFCLMLLNGGELCGRRILSRKAVALMTSNHLPPRVATGPRTADLGVAAPLAELGQGYGLGVGVRLKAGRATVPGSVGDFYWGGASGTYFWVDPAERLLVVFMLQEFDMQRRTRYRSVLRNLVYQALR